ncbi:hypothetical protein ACFC1R_38295 [Kitasatospora sp. NPDC056138]
MTTKKKPAAPCQAHAAGVWSNCPVAEPDELDAVLGLVGSGLWAG